MAGRLTGKTALVTAAGQGFGRATAIAFADEGATVWATDINEATLATLVEGRPGIRARRLDVCDWNAVEIAAREIGTIDVSSIALASFIKGRSSTVRRRIGIFHST
jgi:2-keto-3-deoxy-L-fuconate dehydrogenase